MISSLEINNIKSKGKLKVKEKNTNPDAEDKGSKFIDEGLNFKKGNKKGRYQCTYCNRYSHNENYFFKNKIEIMTQFLERNNIDVPVFARRENLLIPRSTVTLWNSTVDIVMH